MTPEMEAVELSPSQVTIGRMDNVLISETGMPDQIWAELTPALLIAKEVAGTETLGDFYSSAYPQILSYTDLGSTGERRIDELTNNTSLQEILSSRIVSVLDELDQKDLSILITRYREKKVTLADLGEQMGMTRERVRQLQRKAEGKIEYHLGTPMKMIAKAVVLKHPIEVSKEQLEGDISELYPNDNALHQYFVRKTIEIAGYQQLNGTYLTPFAQDELKKFRLSLKWNISSEEVIPESEVIELSERMGGIDIDTLTELIKLKKLYNGYYSFRNTIMSRLHAFLKEIGEPVTKEEMMRGTGLRSRQVEVVLMNSNSIVRATKDKWGLREYVEEEYRGISAEIEDRINQEGGSTSMKRLLEEIPRKFDVKRGSIYVYAKTPRFKIEGDRISLAEPEDYQYRDLDEVIDGRDEEGRPYQDFIVKEQHFRGFSQPNFTPEFAREVGCWPDSHIKAHVVYPEAAEDVSVTWKLSSATYASIGYLTQPLRVMGAQPGDRIEVAILGFKKLGMRLANSKQDLVSSASSLPAGPANAPSEAEGQVSGSHPRN